jgi:hypothetical protein
VTAAFQFLKRQITPRCQKSNRRASRHEPRGAQL